MNHLSAHILISFLLLASFSIAQERKTIKQQLKEDGVGKYSEYYKKYKGSNQREDEFHLDLGLGFTTTEKLRPKFSYRTGFAFAFKRKEKPYRFRIGVAVGQHFMKTHDRHLSYYPTSDTFYVMNWNVVLYDFDIGWDCMFYEREKTKIYLSLSYHVGSYVHRSRTTRYYDNGQDGNLIDENYKNVGQPTTDAFTKGPALGLGYQRKLGDHFSLSTAPIVYYRVNGHGGHLTLHLKTSVHWTFPSQ